MVSKYGNKQCAARDGKIFASKKERDRYEELLLLQRCSQISNLKLQVKYDLLPAQMGGKRHERAVSYTCDFEYLDWDGVKHVEDVKSPATRTQQYVLRRKMLLYFHGIAIEEL